MVKSPIQSEKIKKLDEARKQLSRGWLQTEREKTRLAAAIDNLPLGFLIVDDYNKLVLKNVKVDEILGYRKKGEWDIETIQNKLAGPFDLNGACTKCFHDRKSCGPVDLEFANKFIRIFLSPIFFLKESVTPFGVTLLIEDITADRKAEQEKDKFLSIASHELKAPLAAIRGNTEIILGGSLDDDLRKKINDINNGAIRLIEIVHDFIDASRLEKKIVEFKKEKFLMSALIKEVIDDVKHLIAAKGLVINYVESQNDSAEVIADRERTRQVLYNLIDNSLKFTDRGSINIFSDANRKFLKVSVTDTGLGIDNATKKLLFKKFMVPGKGSGIGLYISKLLVEDMGGEIFLENSQLGKGSTFSFTLPLSAPGL